MALPPGSPNIPFLPPEIHLVIAQHVHRDDLPNYRLTSKVFAEVGKPEIFHTITLRPTRTSVSRFKHIKQSEELAKLVCTLLLDTNLWRVGANVRDWHEWTRYCESQAENIDYGQSVLYRELAASRQLWEAYLSRLEDEKKAITEIKTLFYGLPFTEFKLPNLQKIYVVKGAYKFHNWHVYRTAEHATIPVTVPLSAWRGDSFSRSSDDTRLTTIPAAAVSVKKWRFNGLTVKDLDMLSVASQHRGKDYNPISITIRLGVLDITQSSYMKSNWLAVLLGRWRNLESIRVDLSSRVIGENHLKTSIRTIQDTFEITEGPPCPSYPEGPVTWPKLRKLSLGHFDSTPNALLSLIARHSSTLKDLRLHAIWLEVEHSESFTKYSWRDIFYSIGTTTNLENVTLSGEFCDTSIRNDMWDFNDEDLARVVATWIVNGGECPLTDKYESIREST